MKIKDFKTMAFLVGILSLTLVMIGVTLSLFNYAQKGSKENIITTGKITFLYTETSFGRGIKLEDAIPVSDTVGIAQTGVGNVFDFKITADTMNYTSIPYIVTMVKQDGSDLKESDVKIYITEVNDNVEENGLIAVFNDNGKFTKYEGRDTERIIYRGEVPNNTSNYIQNLRLKMWIDENADFSPLKDDDGNYIIQDNDYVYPNNGKTFKIKVNVYSYGNVLIDDDILEETKAGVKKIKVNGSDAQISDTDDKMFEVLLEEGTNTASIEIETTTKYQKIRMEKTDENYNPIKVVNTANVSLEDENNYFKITIKSEDGESKTEEYKLKINASGKLLTNAIFGAYQSKELTVELDNNINSPTYAFNNTSEAKGQNGLYKYTYMENGEEKVSYYFRGNVNNNYVSFAGSEWKVVRINEDGTIRLIMKGNLGWSQTNNSSANGINSYFMNWNENEGYVKYTLSNWYNTNIASNDKYKNRIAVSEGSGYFCGAGQGSVTTLDSFPNVVNHVPTFKCVTIDGYGLLKIDAGLLTYDEAVLAGGYRSNYTHRNTSFYLKDVSFYTMSPATTSYGHSRIWFVTSNGEVDDFSGNTGATIRPVINLKADTMVTGSGGSGANSWVVVN